MKILILAAMPVEAASTRYRIMQYLPILKDNEIEYQFFSFISSSTYHGLYKKNLSRTIVGVLGSLLKSIIVIARMTQTDIVWIEREAAPFGPPVLEWLAATVFKLPIIIDIDDAVYIKRDSPVYGKWLNLIKFYGKTEKIIEWSNHIICGNFVVQQYAASINKDIPTSLIPTTVNTSILRPKDNDKTASTLPLVIGWIGSHSTATFLEPLFGVFQELAHKHYFVLRIIGANKDISIPTVNVECLQWDLNHEVADFQSLDIGIYPLPNTDIANGKSGFKAIQYMAVGIPFVASPVGLIEEIVKHGQAGFLAQSTEKWYLYLDQLLSNAKLRHKMGATGRTIAKQSYDMHAWGHEITQIILKYIH